MWSELFKHVVVSSVVGVVFCIGTALVTTVVLFLLKAVMGDLTEAEIVLHSVALGATIGMLSFLSNLFSDR